MHVGPPLSAKERGALPWLPDETALLSLPSGALFVDSNDTLRAHPHERPTEKDATLQVPAGRYLLTLHRLDSLRLDESYQGPIDLITLTPTELERAPEPEPMLGDGRGPVPETASQVVDGQLSTEVLQVVREGDRVSLARAFDEDHLAALARLPGGRLLIEVGGHEYAAFHHGDYWSWGNHHRTFGPERRRELASDPGLESYLGTSSVPDDLRVAGHGEWLSVLLAPGAPAADFPLFDVPVGTPATVRAGEPFIDTKRMPKSRVVDGELRAEVIASHPGQLMLGIEYAALRKLGWSEDAWLELEVAGHRLPVMDEKGVPAAWDSSGEARREAVYSTPGALSFAMEKYWAKEGKHLLALKPVQHLSPAKYDTSAYQVPVVPRGTPAILRLRPA